MQQKKQEIVSQANNNQGFTLNSLFARQKKIFEKSEVYSKKNERLELVEAAFQEVLEAKSYYNQITKENLQKIADMKIGSEDIEEFIAIFGRYKDHKSFQNRAGLFISDLCNICSDEKITLHITHIDIQINYIGYRNRKELIVNGNLGSFAGQDMKGGQLTINGSAANMVGAFMEGGRISVAGSVLDLVGAEMKGGAIFVSGSARDKVGYKMKGGRITIMGSVRDDVGCEMSGGDIDVYGNARKNAGMNKTGGSIIIHGFAGEGLNLNAKGKPVYVLGNIQRS
ncbi:MAG: hypothetical protein N3G80_04610 [Candidatus Micrarchaeota archaeon]|nr:hypothetical protein [Candidatus Micrarchaeota archaeon]